MHRRSFITGLISLVAAPAIVRVGSLMPVKSMIVPLDFYGQSPMMDALPMLEEMNEIHDQINRAFALPAATWRLLNSGVEIVPSTLVRLR